MTANFQKDLKKGQKYEKEFKRWFPMSLEALDGKLADFKCTDTGETLELKTDFHDTPNFFMERYSDAKKQTPGGPWQALEKNIKWFVVYFPKTSSWHIFETAELVRKLDELSPTLAPRNIYNVRWITMGYIVPKALIKDIEYKIITQFKRCA